MHDAGESIMRQQHQSILRTINSYLRTKCAARGLRHLKGEEGTNPIEYAFIFTLYMTMLFGICGFAFALYAYHFVSHAAKSATRWAAVNGFTCASDSSCVAPATQADIQNYVSQITPPGINPNNLTVTASWPSTTGICATQNNQPGCTVQVQVSYNYSFILPLVTSKALTLSSASEMIIAH